MEHIYKIWNKIWKDVFSNVFALGIVALISTIWISIGSFLNSITLINKLLIILGGILVTAFFVLVLIKRKKDKLLIYVSYGGTCRDPMAMIITQKLMEEKKIEKKWTIFGRALHCSDSKAHYAAKHAINTIYGTDLLSSYKPQTITKEECEKADLILVMSRFELYSLLKSHPYVEKKTYKFKDFFGFEGDIDDPWQDSRGYINDNKTLQIYLNCANEMKQIIHERFEYLTNALSI